MLLPSLKLRYL